MQTPKKKLIEVALPLDVINYHAAREKSIRHGHPSTLHLWWARRPLAACRAVLFASLVDDPSAHPDKFPTEEAQKRERDRLFDEILADLVRWENSNNEQVLEKARKEILASTGGNPPPVLDPFCGGGSIPLEAQRLGLQVFASDLNPVAVLITKALVEIPPKFAGHPPVNPEARSLIGGDRNWRGAAGLAEDVRYYGRWMRERAWDRIGHLYPTVRLPKEQGGGEATVIAWLWARTVRCPNPACGAQMPLVRSFVLSSKRNVYVEPVVDRAGKRVEFQVRQGGRPPEPPKVGRGAKFRCLVCKGAVEDDYIKAEASAGRMSAALMALVAEGRSGRVYVAPDQRHIEVAAGAMPDWGPDEPLAYEPRAIWCTLYGLRRFRDLFTPRQLVALTTFSDLVGEARQQLLADGATEDYANAVATYLALGVSRLANRSSTICFWDTTGENVQQVFARQAIPMTWDFAEGNPFSSSTGNFLGQLEYLLNVLENLPTQVSRGEVSQLDVRTGAWPVTSPLVFTDPPYYDNIGYADLSDFFYVWLRRCAAAIYPDLFRTVLTPKTEELIASPYRFGGDAEQAKRFFEEGLQKAFERMRDIQHPDYPLALYYAFKQSEVEAEGDEAEEPTETVVSTGWETMLQGLVSAGFQVTATWPIRTELVGNLKKNFAALASSIVIACRVRPADAPRASRAEFLRALRKELPEALRRLKAGHIAPVDLAQAAIGPGMAVFSRYSAILEADGTPMTVRIALGLINQVLDEVLAEQEAEFDAETRWALAWFDQNAFREGPFGDAETLSKAKNVAVQGLVEAGILWARGGKVRLLRRDELDSDWDPSGDHRLTVWEAAHHLIRRLETKGEDSAGELLARLPADLRDPVRDLAYRLYTICDRRGWAELARDYNGLVAAWSRITSAAARPQQQTL
jgi:putative DNA methylase